MNKYEQLIEHIINEQEDKARKLFHAIVVEKSRSIYENLMDEEDFEETVGGNQIDSLIDDVESDEIGMQEANDEVGADDDEIDVDVDSDLDLEQDSDADVDFNNDDNIDDHEAAHGTEEERISDLESALEELKAEFDSLMSDNDSNNSDDSDEEEGVAEGGSPSPDMSDQQAKKVMDLCRKGYTPDQIAGRYPNLNKDEIDNIWGSMDDSELDEGMIREYVENKGEVYKGKLDPTSDGETVGTGGDRPVVNKQSVVANANRMGGVANLAKGGTEQNPDGKQVPTPSNEYTKKRGELPGAGNFENVPGANTKGYKNKATSYEKAKGKEGQTTNGKMPVDTKSLVGGKVR